MVGIKKEKEIAMTTQEKIIGKHPNRGIYFEWTECEDTECTNTKRHRQLLAKENSREQAINQMAEWLVLYHLSDAKKVLLNRKKVILEKYDFAEYAKMLHVFPQTDKTKKGNLGEVILTEYLSQTTGISILIYKLRYNPNVDQSMKGDDVLLVGTNRIIVGESKFRSNATKQAVDKTAEIMKSSLALPLSLGFIADRLFEQGLFDLSAQIQEMQINLGKAEIDIKNAALLLSTNDIGSYVEKHMDSTNQDFVFISLGMDDPPGFMEATFSKANELLLEVK